MDFDEIRNWPSPIQTPTPELQIGLWDIHGMSDTFTKMNIPHFDGYFDSEDLLDWGRKVDEFFESSLIEPPTKEAKVVAKKFKSYDAYWWNRLQ